MGGGGGTQTTKTQNAPWKEAAPYFIDLFKQAQTAFNATPKTPYTGSFYADPNKIQQQAVSETVQRAPWLSYGAGAVRDEAMKTISGDYLKAGSNPYLQSAMTAAIRPQREDLMQNIMPAIGSAAQSQGAYGGSRHGIVERGALRDFNRAALDTRGTMAFGNYNAERDRMSQAPQMFGQANSLSLATPQALAAAGDQIYNWDQNKVNEALQKWNEVKKAPWTGLGEFANILGTGGFSSTTSQVQQPSVPFGQQMLQTGLALPGMLTGFGMQMPQWSMFG